MKKIISYVDTRPNATKLHKLLDDGMVSEHQLLEEMVNYLSDDDIGNILVSLELDGWEFI